MKKIFFCILISLSILNSYAQCDNGDAEFGNFTLWSGYIGLNNSPVPGLLDLSTFTPGIIVGRQEITTKGNYDPIVGGTILPTVAEGNHAIKLGNSSIYQESEILSYTFTVTDDNANFSFRYALVFEAFHPAPYIDDNPFFLYWVSTNSNLQNSINHPDLIFQKKFIADPTDPFFTAVENSGTWQYKNWQTECVNLSEYVGQTVTIFFATADCYQGGHAGYAYIDGLCTPNLPTVSLSADSIVCSRFNINADGSGSTNYDEHYWQLEQLNSNNINDVVAGTAIRQDFNTPISNNFSLSSMYTMNGGSLVNDGFYKVTLGVRNCTGVWVEKSVVVEVHSPAIIAPNKHGCCTGNPVSIQFEASVTIANTTTGTFMWYDENNNFVGYGTTTTTVLGLKQTLHNTISINISQNSKFKVYFGDLNGCSNEKWVYAVLIKHPVYTIEQTCIGPNACYARRLTLKKNFQACGPLSSLSDEYASILESLYSYQWNTGDSTIETTTNSSNPNYWVIAKNDCYTDTIYVNVPSNPYPGPFPSLSATPAMYDTSAFRIYDVTIGMTSPAYNAYHYKLVIENRWGKDIYVKEDYTCNGFLNGEISWDGYANGVFQPMDTYHYMLYLENCDNPISFNTPTKQGQFHLIW